MAKFTGLKPEDVVLGRGIVARQARAPYVAALKASEAGKVEVDRGERPATVKRLLQDAAKDLGVRVRSSWADPKQPQVLFWKKVGTR